MTLPRPSVEGKRTVNIGGTDVTIRGLTRREATDPTFLEKMTAVDAGDMRHVPWIECYFISCALDEKMAAVEEWWCDQPAVFIDELVQAIVHLSGLDKGYQREPNKGPQG